MSESETRLFLAAEDAEEKVTDKLDDYLSSLDIREFLVDLTKLRANKLLDTSLANNQDEMSLMLCGTDIRQIMATRRWVRGVVVPAIMKAVDDLEREEREERKKNESSEQGPSGEAAAPLHQPDDDEVGSEAGQ